MARNDEYVEDASNDGGWRVLFGMLIPGFLVWFGINSIANKSSTMFGSGLWRRVAALDLHGNAAIWLGVCSLGLALLLFSRFIIRHTLGFWRFAVVGEAIGWLTWLIALIIVIMEVGVKSWQ